LDQVRRLAYDADLIQIGIQGWWKRIQME
jgi:hypothetical protein